MTSVTPTTKLPMEILVLECQPPEYSTVQMKCMVVLCLYTRGVWVASKTAGLSDCVRLKYMEMVCYNKKINNAEQKI